MPQSPSSAIEKNHLERALHLEKSLQKLNYMQSFKHCALIGFSTTPLRAFAPSFSSSLVLSIGSLSTPILPILPGLYFLFWNLIFAARYLSIQYSLSIIKPFPSLEEIMHYHQTKGKTEDIELVRSLVVRSCAKLAKTNKKQLIKQLETLAKTSPTSFHDLITQNSKVKDILDIPYDLENYRKLIKWNAQALASDITRTKMSSEDLHIQLVEILYELRKYEHLKNKFSLDIDDSVFKMLEDANIGAQLPNFEQIKNDYKTKMFPPYNQPQEALELEELIDRTTFLTSWDLSSAIPARNSFLKTIGLAGVSNFLYGILKVLLNFLPVVLTSFLMPFLPAGFLVAIALINIAQVVMNNNRQKELLKKYSIEQIFDHLTASPQLTKNRELALDVKILYKKLNQATEKERASFIKNFLQRCESKDSLYLRNNQLELFFSTYCSGGCGQLSVVDFTRLLKIVIANNNEKLLTKILIAFKSRYPDQKLSQADFADLLEQTNIDPAHFSRKMLEASFDNYTGDNLPMANPQHLDVMKKIDGYLASKNLFRDHFFPFVGITNYSFSTIYFILAIQVGITIGLSVVSAITIFPLVAYVGIIACYYGHKSLMKKLVDDNLRTLSLAEVIEQSCMLRDYSQHKNNGDRTIEIISRKFEIISAGEEKEQFEKIFHHQDGCFYYGRFCEEIYDALKEKKVSAIGTIIPFLPEDLGFLSKGKKSIKESKKDALLEKYSTQFLLMALKEKNHKLVGRILKDAPQQKKEEILKAAQQFILQYPSSYPNSKDLQDLADTYKVAYSPQLGWPLSQTTVDASDLHRKRTKSLFADKPQTDPVSPKANPF